MRFRYQNVCMFERDLDQLETSLFRDNFLCHLDLPHIFFLLGP